MKNFLVKNAVAIILIICSLFLFGCKSDSIEVKKNNESAVKNSEKTNTVSNPNNDKISYVYYANENGEFYLYPKLTLPEDYDARKRPWYIESIKSTQFISEPYQDMASGNNIISFAKVVSNKNINIGVVGLDRVLITNR